MVPVHFICGRELKDTDGMAGAFALYIRVHS